MFSPASVTLLEMASRPCPKGAAISQSPTQTSQIVTTSIAV
jgi:hypothetical protein